MPRSQPWQRAAAEMGEPMQILHTAALEAHASAPEESEFGTALRQLEQNLDGNGRPVAHLAAACAAALRSLDVIAADDGVPPAARLSQAMHIDEAVEPRYERIGRWLPS